MKTALQQAIKWGEYLELRNSERNQSTEPTVRRFGTRLATLAGAMVFTVSGCGGGAAVETAVATPPPVAIPTPIAKSATIFGVIKDASTNKPVSGAKVAAGLISTTTGADGSYLLQAVPLGRTLVNITANQYSPTTGIVNATEKQGQQNQDFNVQPVGTAIAFDPTLAQSLKDPSSPASVILTAGSLVGSANAAPVGQVVAKLTTISSNLMPGDYTTNTDEQIQSFGAINVEFTDANSNALNLAGGKTATIRIPASISGTGTLPATSPLYYYDVALGKWVQQGSATLINAVSGSYYEGTVSHFTVWNADQVMDVVRVKGRLLDVDGLPVTGVPAICTGINYTNISTVLTDGSGNFSVPVKKNAQMECHAALNGAETTHSTLVTGTTDLLVGDVTFPIKQASAIVLGDTFKRIDNMVYPLGTGLSTELHIPFESIGITVGAGWSQTYWEVTSVFNSTDGLSTYGAWPDGNNQISALRIDNLATPNTGVMSIRASIAPSVQDVRNNVTSLTLVVRLVGVKVSATTGKSYKTSSAPKIFTLSLIRQPVVANGLTWLPLNPTTDGQGRVIAETMSYAGAKIYCKDRGYRLPTLSEALAFYPNGPFGKASGSWVGAVWVDAESNQGREEAMGYGGLTGSTFAAMALCAK